MKCFPLALALLLVPAAASAQCNGVFPNNTVCGNITGAGNLPRPTAPSAFLGAAGGSNGQIQYNNAGALGGLTDTQVTARIGAFTSGLSGAAPASGGGTTKFLRADGTWQAPPAGASNAAQYGILCDGTTDDGPAFRMALSALAGAPLILPAGTCRIATTAYYNTTAAAGILTVPGAKIYGQGRGVTKIEADVANGYAIALNQDWAAAHKSMYILTPLTTGTLATNTYYIQLTVTNPASTEVYVGLPKSVAVTGPSGSVQLTLSALNSGYCYNLYIGTANPPVNYATVSATDAICLAGNQTVTITGTGSAHAVPTTTRAVWQEAQLANLSIVNETATAAASGVLWFRVAYSQMSNVYMKGLSGDGLDIPNWTGDVDGSFVVTVDQSKFDTIAGWCIMAAGNTLEFSNFTVSNSVFNICGTPPSNLLSPITITAITNANPGVVTTASAHNLQSGDQVLIENVAGMTLATAHYRACGTVSGSTFSICDLNGNNVNTTSLGAYTASSGDEKLSWRPPQMQANGNGPSMSGAIAYTGLISNWFNNGFTQNNNVDFYFSEAGSNDNLTMWGNDLENTNGKGVYIATAINLSWTNGECLTTSVLGATVSCMQLGTGLNKGGAQNVTIDGIKIRSDVGLANGFEQLLGAGGLSYPQTVSVRNVYWQAWIGLNKYVNFNGNPFPFFWARFDGKTGAACTLKDSRNVASCVRNGTGDYTLTFTVPSLDANYSVNGLGQQTGTGVGIIGVAAVGNLTTTTARVGCYVANAVATLQDCDIVNVTGYGNPN